MNSWDIILIIKHFLKGEGSYNFVAEYLENRSIKMIVLPRDTHLPFPYISFTLLFSLLLSSSTLFRALSSHREL